MTLKSLILTAAPGCTLAVAESLTCGRLQAIVGSESGASSYFLGGITAYTLEQKVEKLGVDHIHAESVNCVSARVASEMACGVCHFFGSDLGLATTGYAEASPATGVKTPWAYWAIASRTGGKVSVVRQGRLEKNGVNRVQMQEATASCVIEELMSFLQGLKKGEL
ncbi:MAG: CinA family protein [Opitutaceae bacterium]|nr:CinA family protein [Opitutaceae bacterium]